VASAILLQVIVELVVRRRALSSLLVASVVGATVTLWAIPIAVLVLIPFAVNGGRVGGTVGRYLKRMPSIESIAANSGFAIVILIVWLSFQAGVVANEFSYRSAPVDRSLPAQPHPDVYLVLLDGYPRADVLASRFGIQTGEFLSDLQERGFHVSPGSRSSYSATWLTLASLFQMEYVHEMRELADLPLTGPSQYRALGRLINSAPVIEILRAVGYQIVSSPTAYSDVALTNADQVFDTVGMTTFEQLLLERTVLASAAQLLTPMWMAGMQAERVTTALDRLADVASRDASTPVFMFDHVLSPHPPFVLREDGSLRPLASCYPQRCHLWAPAPENLELSLDEYAEGLRGQVAALNTALLERLDVVIRERPDAIVILFSDHATRYDIAGDPEEANLNFFAARTPSRPALFGDAPTTVNIVSTLLNWQLDLELPQRDGRIWLSETTPLDLRELRP
jgi:hypothetical protein